MKGNGALINGEGENNMKFEVTKDMNLDEIEEAKNDNLEFVIEDGKLFCIVPDME